MKRPGNFVLFLGLIGAGAMATLFANLAMSKPQTVRLWEGDAPGALGKAEEDIPTITVYRPGKNNTGAAVIICPGGGYGVLAPHEGKPVAEWLNKIGVTGIVLKYRIAPKYHHPAPLTDVLRAVRFTRAHAKEWKLDPERIGVIGFSAGGHLASTASTHFDEGDKNALDPVEQISSRPTLSILIYPVITFTEPFLHHGSRNNLIGEPSDKPAFTELTTSLSSEQQVTGNTPPAFLVHGANDTVVPCENVLLYADALRKHHVPVELHLYENLPHGIGVGNKNLPSGTWTTRCEEWLKARGFLTPK